MNNQTPILDRLTGYLDSDPNNLKLLLECIAAARATKDVRAQAFVERVLQIDPHNSKALFVAGEICLEEKNHDAAIRHFESLLQNPAAGHAARYNLALCRLLQGQYDAAEAALVPLTRLPQAWPEVYGLMGRIQFFKKQIEEAKASLEQCLQLDPRNEDALGLFALLLVDIGSKQATGFAERALTLNQQNYEAQLALASVALLEDRLPEARRRFSGLVENYPATGRALLGMGLLELREGHYPAAETWLSQCTQFMPTHADVRNGLGWALLANAKTALAVDAFRKAVELSDTNAEYRSALACALVFDGQLDEARTQLAKAKQGGLSAEWTEWLLDLQGKSTPTGPLDVRKLTAEALGPNGENLQRLMHRLVKSGSLPPHVLH